MSLITCRIRHSASQLSSSQAHFLIVSDSFVGARQISALCVLYIIIYLGQVASSTNVLKHL